MMLYLNTTGHGGTAFFRHRSTGLSSLTAEAFPPYAEAVAADFRRTGMPPAAYPTDGAPHFERIHIAEGRFNRAVFYRGNILHSGVIDNAAPLSADPRAGRLTINAFFRPAPG
jgi:predicted membrane metal-binding protein